MHSNHPIHPGLGAAGERYRRALADEWASPDTRDTVLARPPRGTPQPDDFDTIVTDEPTDIGDL